MPGEDKMKRGIIDQNKKGKFFVKGIGEEAGKTFSLALYGDLSQFLGKECQFETQGPHVSKLIIDGKEIEKKPDQSQASSKEKGSSSPEFKLPKDTGRISKNFQWRPENFLLCLQKYAPWEKAKEEEEKEKPNLKKAYSNCTKGFSEKLIEKIQKTQGEIISEFQKMGYKAHQFTAQPFWRMTVGLGTASVYEISMTLHHIYGIPYIPASAIKGLLRAYYIIEKFDKDEEAAEKDSNFKKIFGISTKENSQQGGVIFLDAYPTQRPKIKLDIINPHYKDYYEGTSPPADYLNPNPINFLVVEDTPFSFVLLVRSKGPRALNQEEIEEVMENLKKALKTYGIGAKTALGYGVMKINP